MTRRQFRLFGLAAVILPLLLGACALPKITVLDDPLTPEEHLQLGAAYEKNHEYELAEREYRLAAKHRPEARLFLANLFFLQGKFEPAEAEYRRVIRELPDQPQAYNNLAWLFYVRGINLDEAEALARQALKLAPPGQASEYLDTLDKILSAAPRP